MADAPAVHGFHHVTLVCGDAQRTVDFYAGVLGLRLVKRTVNFDDPSSYHLYFGDHLGTPGTILTFFEWPRSAPGYPGAGGTHHVALVVASRDGLLRWKRRLTDLGVEVRGPYARRGYDAVSFCDPDGAILELAAVSAPSDAGGEVEGLDETAVEPVGLMPQPGAGGGEPGLETWPEAVSEIAPGMDLRGGVHHLTVCTADLEMASAFYGDLLGWRRIRRRRNPDDPEREQWTFAPPQAPAGAHLTLTEVAGRARRAALGTGQTHHFALAVPDPQSQLDWRQRLVEAAAPVSQVLDRVYFRSIYSRDPDGHIVELATLGPGFEADEPTAGLGTTLCLPPWLEANRDALSARLRPLRAARVPARLRAIHRDLAESVGGPHEGLPVLLGGAPFGAGTAAGAARTQGEPAAAAMVLLHGRGASAADILTLGQQIARSVPRLALVAPQAAGGSWYPYSFLATLESNEPHLGSALATLAEALRVVERSGVPAERTILLGFSQGACLALEYAARHARRYGAVAGLSGGLIGPPGTPRDYPGSLAGTPVLLGCDEHDPHIPRQRVEESAKVLERLGAEVTTWIYSGLGHAVHADELEWVRARAAELAGVIA